LFLFVSCKQSTEDISLTQVVESGDIKVQVKPSAKVFRTCDLLELSIEIFYPQDFKIKLPDSKSNFGDFSVYQINQNSPVNIDENFNKLYQIIILEPGLPAKHKLPSLTISYWDIKNKEHKISTDAIDFEVKSILKGETSEEIEDIIIVNDGNTHIVTIVGSSALFVTLFYFIFICKPEKVSVEDPALIALDEFKNLVDLDTKELLSKLPKIAATFIKLKFNLKIQSNNLDTILKSLTNNEISESQSSVLNSYFKEYNAIRFGSAKVDKENLVKLHNSFTSLFEEMLK